MIKVHQLALLKDGKMEDYINHINQVSNKIDLVMEIMNTSKLEEISVLTIIDQIGQLHLEVSETEATTHFHSRQNTTDIRIPMLQEQYYKVKEKLNLLYNKLDHFLLNLPQSCLEKILKDNIVGSQTFYLQERLEMAKSQLPSTLDSMARNGLRSWTCLRQTMIQRVKFSLTMDGTDKMITGPQAIHLMFTSHPDKKVRHELHHKFEEALQPDLDLFAIAMNEITNIHLKIQESRGNMNQPLSETLKMNRISKHSLVSMEKAIDENLSRFVPYFHRKAELLGMNNFGEKDLIATIGNPKLNVPFKEA
ncbi:MAG TPA: hypothetical protein VEV44_13830, partial [Pseudoneobacillus sp.]|nr:hypothetical protein [Pseudoneobacillus sp.]